MSDHYETKATVYPWWDHADVMNCTFTEMNDGSCAVTPCCGCGEHSYVLVEQLASENWRAWFCDRCVRLDLEVLLVCRTGHQYRTDVVEIRHGTAAFKCPMCRRGYRSVRAYPMNVRDMFL